VTTKRSASRNHPYMEYEGTRLWQILERTLSELVDNQDLRETTRREYIVGYLAKQLTKAGLVGE
jgi:hypothetical protein